MVKADPWYNTRLDVVDLDELEGDWDAETLYSNSHPVLLDMNFNELLREQQGPIAGDTASVSVAGDPWCRPTLTRYGAGKPQGRGLLSNSMALVTMLPRISAAHKELSAVRRSAIPLSLDRQKKILNDLLEITRCAYCGAPQSATGR